MASLASFNRPALFGLLHASKAAVRVWGESIRLVLKKSGGGRQRHLPGLRGQPHDGQRALPMPFLMTSARASAIIRRGLAANHARIAFPIAPRPPCGSAKALPGRWTARLLGA